MATNAISAGASANAPDDSFPLFSTFQIGGVALKNRLVLSPMCTYSARGGMVDDFHLAHLAKFAMGGFGLVMTEATAVTRDGRITHGDLGIWQDEQVHGMRRITDLIHTLGAKAGIQLAHAGRKASMQRPWDGNGPLDHRDVARGERAWEIVGPGTEPMELGWLSPRALSQPELTTLVERWKHAAARAEAAGFDVIEIHAAHGYLLHQFLSPLANSRTDHYGGTLENRMRLALEVVAAVREVWPARKPLFFRVSATDAADGGWSLEDSAVLATALQALGVDVVDCSSGGVAAPQASTGLPRSLGFQVPLARSIKDEVGIATMAVGLIVDAHQANDIVASGAADLVAIGRAALHDPHWPLHAQENLQPAVGYAGWPQPYGWWLERRKKVLQAALSAADRRGATPLV
ncbi:NADH:flavin oxidoreductase/NADH oxidase [Variovorax arabinosiphilus]|uniref:NADH:flavin oxidoreductase/NADH oxidase n=1 Tax=Variovorax arabinosiphilus TaxID=3053498 RepID=UPI0025765645|nr:MULTISPECIES: NADH:flavin oxidoreductase/NADH oxidase [unclassified Variovorax]MDM0118380.1 NADH:flavin oxidoreductase/NADH oxidase [Variovorax sp. J2L1-78]MDM0128805.1 NADH:flavin oxidoreductase/NADH oxidase [Variovorax sp. J2L1-63]MDM0233409.1 NADH:flavin oxidoreductase/NADH oxidase [Variovorax sp. J2R1-6]